MMLVDMRATRTMYSFYITTPLREGLKRIKDREGISESEQIRRAIEMWLASKEGKRAATRKRR